MTESFDNGHFNLIGKGKVGDVVELVGGIKNPSVKRVSSELISDQISRINSSQRVRGLSSITDENGNVYVLGQYFQNMFTDNIFLTTPESGIFLAQIDSKGVWKWATNIHEHTTANDVNMSCEIKYVHKHLYIAMVIVTSGPVPSEGFVVKTDRGGNIIYSTRFTGNLIQQIRLSLDKWDNVYIVNSYINKLVLTDKITLPEKPITNNIDNQRGYVAKLDSKGNWVWARDVSAFSENDASNLNDIVTQPNGHSYVVGFFVGNAKLDDIEIPGSGIFEFREFLLAEIDSRGCWLRATSFQGGQGNGIAMDCDKNIYIIGGFFHKMKLGGEVVCSKHKTTNLFVSKLDSCWRTDWIKFTKFEPEINNDFGSTFNIILDPDNNSYINGMFDTPLRLGNIVLFPRGEDNNEFIAQLSPYGNWLWATQLSGIEASESQDLAIDPVNNLYLTGGFFTELVLGRCKSNKIVEYSPDIGSLYLIRFHPTLPRLLGIITQKTGKKVIVKFGGLVPVRIELETSENYYVTEKGEIVPDPRYRYIGTATSRDTLFVNQ
jgi:hypothetical protein